MHSDLLHEDGRSQVWASLLPLHPKLLAIARMRATAASEAEDAVHETYLRIVDKDDLDLDRLEGFAIRVLTNVCHDQHRRRARDGRKHLRAVTLVAQSEPSPEEAVCDHAEAVMLRSHFDSLSARERQVLELIVGGHSLPEVADLLDVTQKAVSHAYYRARDAMRVIAHRSLV